MSSTLPLFAALLFAIQLSRAAHLTPETARAFDRYIELTEARMNSELAPGRFLSLAGKPDLKARL
ncbi:MAG TPA: hypothetical protein VGY58_14075, partial [Gemmataceae bacterium]|nr:hypothetical protein [Gemmataceae bacterium]